MRHSTTKTFKLFAILIVIAIIPSFRLAELPQPKKVLLDEEVVDMKQVAFQILNTKCNVCHRRKNPFMVFSMKNMERRAAKIYKQVIITKRMPKGNQIKLTNEEYTRLKQWLQTQNIY